ncbi:hypothetical protein [Polymorphospora sp. NPDC050346]|uniref:hypothetical protein n=1 Tax=Polymorphospora sp. NPDC050346 TaxID=3155780 RepID=UPI0033DD7ED8
MTEPIEQQHPDPIGEGLRRQLNNLTVVASFAEAVARWRYTQAQQRAERDAHAAEAAARAAQQQARDAKIIKRFNAAQHRAAAAVYRRAENTDFLLNADLKTLGETWAAAAAYHDTDPQAAAAMERVEIRLRVVAPEAMAYYDQMRADGVAPVDAMSKAVWHMDPGPTQSGPTAREGYGKAGAVRAGPATGGDLVPVGGPGDIPRPPTTTERLEHLRHLDTYLAGIAPHSPDPAAVDRIRDQMRQDITHIEAGLRGGRGAGRWHETPALDQAMARWVKTATPAEGVTPQENDSQAFRLNRLQRRAATTDYSRAFEPQWLDRADTVQLGQAWAAAAAYPGDRRAEVALERIDDRLRVVQPTAMQLYDQQIAAGASRHEAMLRAVPLMERELPSGRLAGTEPPPGRFTGDGVNVVSPTPEPLPEGRAGRDEVLRRLRTLDGHLRGMEATAGGGPQWRTELGEVRAAIGAEIGKVDTALRGDIVSPRREPSVYRLAGDEQLAVQRAGDLRAGAAADQATRDIPATVVDEQQVAAAAGRVKAAGADRNEALARDTRSAASLAGEGFPQGAGEEVAQARKDRADRRATPATGQTRPAARTPDQPRPPRPTPGR